MSNNHQDTEKAINELSTDQAMKESELEAREMRNHLHVVKDGALRRDDAEDVARIQEMIDATDELVDVLNKVNKQIAEN